jgi:hypothetical protein
MYPGIGMSHIWYLGVVIVGHIITYRATMKTSCISKVVISSTLVRAWAGL